MCASHTGAHRLAKRQSHVNRWHSGVESANVDEATEIHEEVVTVATRFDPFRDLDRIAERMFSSAVDLGQAMRAMPIDLYRDGDHFKIP